MDSHVLIKYCPFQEEYKNSFLNEFECLLKSKNLNHLDLIVLSNYCIDNSLTDLIIITYTEIIIINICDNSVTNQ